jgi:hypothetical protein
MGDFELSASIPSTDPARARGRTGDWGPGVEPRSGRSESTSTGRLGCEYFGRHDVDLGLSCGRSMQGRSRSHKDGLNGEFSDLTFWPLTFICKSLSGEFRPDCRVF